MILSASLVAIDATCRVERPDAITIWSAMFDLPASGMDTTSTRLVVVERLQDEPMKVFDVDRRTAVGGGLSGTVGQVLS